MKQKFFDCVIRFRIPIMVIFVLAAVQGAYAKQLVQVNYDMNDYLPEESSSTVSMDKMQEEFDGGIPNARVAVKDVSYAQALKYKEKLEKETQKAEEELAAVCGELSELRKNYGKQLEERIIQGLQDLNFLDVKFEINFEITEHYTANGNDKICFTISTNPGEPLRPLAKVVSGGELSRIMLAIKTILADKDETETLIFDEIDTGISGRTAQMVAEKMAYIGMTHQVICISHLAQIGAMADSHYLIEKTSRNEHTSTDIRLLDEKESVGELARILGGVEITDSVRESAAEMKQMAEKVKVTLRA